MVKQQQGQHSHKATGEAAAGPVKSALNTPKPRSQVVLGIKIPIPSLRECPQSKEPGRGWALAKLKLHCSRFSQRNVKKHQTPSGLNSTFSSIQNEALCLSFISHKSKCSAEEQEMLHESQRRKTDQPHVTS